MLTYIDDGPVFPSLSNPTSNTKFFVPAAMDIGASRSLILNDILPSLSSRGFPLIDSGPAENNALIKCFARSETEKDYFITNH